MIIPKPSLAFRPLQVIPESKKNIEWIAANGDWAISMSPVYRNRHEDKLYDRYNGKRDESRFKHLSETYGIEFPGGKVEHIPLIRPLLDRLLGQQQDRGWGTQVRASDTDSTEMKTEQMSQGILKEVIAAIKSSDNGTVDTYLDKVEKYYKEDFQTDWEVAAAHVLENYRNRFDLEQTLWDCFQDKEVTGKEYYYCRVNRIGESPEFRTIRPGQLFYPDNNTKWVRDCDWAVQPTRMSPTEIIDRWGDQLSSEEVARIENYMAMFTHDAYKVHSPEEIDSLLHGDSEDPLYNRGYFDKLNVYFVEFKATRKVNMLESPNPYNPNVPFIKHVEEDKLDEIPGSRKKNLKVKYIQDLYQLVRIGDDMYVDIGKVKYPRRNPLMPSRVNLSFNGLTYNGKIKEMSLVKTTENLQDLYDIMHFHKKNLIAMSGTKGSFMDLSQLPDFGSGNQADNIKMYFYYRKMGTAFINRSQEGADGTFTTFPSFNDSLDVSLKVVLDVINHIEELASRVIGVPRQALGDIGQYDGKSNTQSAINNGALVTEPMFNEHDEFVKFACEDIVNACKVTYKNGYNGSYLNSQFLHQIFTVSPEFSAHDYNVYLTNRMSDNRSIEELKMYAQKFVETGMLEFEDILPLFRKSNLKDIGISIKNSIEVRRRAAADADQKLKQIMQQLAQAKEEATIRKLQAEAVKLQEEGQALLKGADLDERALMLEDEIEQKKVENENRRVELEAQELAATMTQARSGGNRREVKNK